jgi:hypothetical protein
MVLYLYFAFFARSLGIFAIHIDVHFNSMKLSVLMHRRVMVTSLHGHFSSALILALLPAGNVTPSNPIWPFDGR